MVGRAADGPGFAVTVAAFAGDWWQAAKLYRTWALRQKWAAKGPIARRTDFPRAMSDIDVWDIVIADKAAVVSNEIVRLKKAFPASSWVFIGIAGTTRSSTPISPSSFRPNPA